MKKRVLVFYLILTTLSCSDGKKNNEQNEELEKLRLELNDLKTSIAKPSVNKKNQISTFFTFQDNNAEEAMNFYIGLFKNSRINEIHRYGKDGPAKEGSIWYAKFELNGSQYMCSDSYVKHEWNFSPATSNFVECESEQQLEYLFSKLSEHGKIMMPLDNYGFSEKFGFIADRFGVSWQLNLQ